MLPLKLHSSQQSHYPLETWHMLVLITKLFVSGRHGDIVQNGIRIFPPQNCFSLLYIHPLDQSQCRIISIDESRGGTGIGMKSHHLT